MRNGPGGNVHFGVHTTRRALTACPETVPSHCLSLSSVSSMTSDVFGVLRCPTVLPTQCEARQMLLAGRVLDLGRQQTGKALTMKLAVMVKSRLPACGPRGTSLQPQSPARSTVSSGKSLDDAILVRSKNKRTWCTVAHLLNLLAIRGSTPRLQFEIGDMGFCFFLPPVSLFKGRASFFFPHMHLAYPSPGTHGKLGRRFCFLKLVFLALQILLCPAEPFHAQSRIFTGQYTGRGAQRSFLPLKSAGQRIAHRGSTPRVPLLYSRITVVFPSRDSAESTPHKVHTRPSARSMA
ncbi:hypothetical protein DFH06DRAFT_191105 [Mycena polygramma]|nr:hypothetical protein DFH06DRAFT_191105 [Mycena polygramma]